MNRKIAFRPLIVVLMGVLINACGSSAPTPFNPVIPTDSNLPATQGRTYYVRVDGGSPQECSGLVNTPYPGSGPDQPCAWDHPFRALPPGGTARISGGDTLMIGPGSYRMGYGAPGAELCDAAGAYDCIMSPIPGGSDPAHATRILGDKQNPPVLWGTERPWFILNLTDSSNVEVAYLEITDHSGCVEFHTGGLACERDHPPYGDWAGYGIYAEDSSNVSLHDLNIHGLAAGGVHAGRIRDWLVERVHIAGNGSVGWDGDLWDDLGDSNAGTMTFRNLTIEWNGCGETYPAGQPTGCWAQEAGGYGDGFATGESGGHWIVEDSVIQYNTSDGLDLLYVREADSSIEIRRTLVRGNAGNQVKTYRGPFLLENSILIGNCGFFAGKPFTYNVDNCRAMGDALELGLTAGDQVTVINNTITSQGDCLVGAEANGKANGTEKVLLRNNIFIGQTDFMQPDEDTCLMYQETFPLDPFDMDYSLITNVKDDLCPGSHDQCGVAPGIINSEMEAFDAHLRSGSRAINAGTNQAAPAGDFDNNAREPQVDIGAYEYNPGAPLPTSSQPGDLVSRQGADDPLPPAEPVKLIFIHHSSGGNWLTDPAENSAGGNLGKALMENNYYVSATNYGWSVAGDAIGDRTDIGNWWEWFRGPNSLKILAALYRENDQNFGDYDSWPRLAKDPGGENQIILFKSCFPNSALQGDPKSRLPEIGGNPLRGQDASSEFHTVANAKGIYIDLLEYFRSRPDKLFIVITAPPLQDDTWAGNTRAFNDWLVNDWLKDYPHQNVAVFDLYNVLTSNGGNPESSDLNSDVGNHHRWWNGGVQHLHSESRDTAAYSSGDDHPDRVGNDKATHEFIQLLNVFYHRWVVERTD